MTLQPISEPSALDLGRAQAVLTAWAAETALVDDRMFDGTVTAVANVTVMRCRLTRLVEARTIAHETGDEWQQLNAVAEWPPLPAPEGFVDQTYRFLVDGSVEVRECDSCHGRGEVSCGHCLGRGEESCPAHESCTWCGGSGSAGTGTGGGRSSCTSCGGSGRQTCSTCHGMGHKDCTWCMGSGERSCGTCDGGGTVTHYDVFVAERKVVRTPVEPDREALPVRVRKDDWEPATVVEPATVPGELNTPHATVVAGLLATPSTDPVLLDRLEVSFTPITAVTYNRDGEPHRAWIVGTGQRVVAPDATRGRRWLTWGLLALVVLAGIAAILFSMR